MWFLLGLTLLAAAQCLPWWLASWYLLLSLVSYGAYAHDKRAAIAKKQRVAETRLQFLGLIGGWPGGILARHHLRHKTLKHPFCWRFRTGVWLNLLLLLGMLLALHPAVITRLQSL
ncbi:DUF1294 domain-containing protein [Shewanella sp. YIC-542]|uniref:DUF1294 domain-containing protein n=1 Tax=Shewanella mytili TaxID=3377111 RepID=UPI00398F7E68